MRSTLFILMLSVLAGCKEKPSPTTTEPRTTTPVVYTTFYPTEFFTTQIAGDTADVICPLPDDADPIYWQPTRDQIAAFQDADLIIINGAEFEKWLAAATLPESRVVDTAAGFEDAWVTYQSTTHAHGAGGEHTHEGIDGHTWVDPINAIAQATAIRDALIERFPENETVYRVSFGALRAELENLNARLQAITEQLDNVQILASHPAYNYLASRYAWQITNFDLDPTIVIDQEALHEIDQALDPSAQTNLMLWESAPDEQTVMLLDALGVTSLTFSPCELLDAERRAAGATYLSVMQDNLTRLEGALGASGG